MVLRIGYLFRFTLNLNKCVCVCVSVGRLNGFAPGGHDQHDEMFLSLSETRR